MQLKNYNIYFFMGILIGITLLTLFMLKPFFIPFIIAVILAHSFFPIYSKLEKWTNGKKGISSMLTCLLIALIIIIPVSMIVYAVVGEIQNTINNFSQTKENINRVVLAIQSSGILGLEKIINQETVSSLVKSFAQNALSILQGIYSSLAYFVFAAFVMFFSLFYVFIDGQKLLKKIMELSPLKDSYEKVLIQKFNAIVYGIIRGNFVIALIQGTIGAVLFWATGVSSPIFLGILMAIASIIPYFGTGLVWIPTGIVMIIIGHFVPGVIILLVGTFIVATVDNILSPKLISKGSQMHPLLILFSTLGGLILFGAMGFIIGPIVMSFFVVLWDIYSLEFKQQLESYNGNG